MKLCLLTIYFLFYRHTDTFSLISYWMTFWQQTVCLSFKNSYWRMEPWLWYPLWGSSLRDLNWESSEDCSIGMWSHVNSPPLYRFWGKFTIYIWYMISIVYLRKYAEIYFFQLQESQISESITRYYNCLKMWFLSTAFLFCDLRLLLYFNRFSASLLLVCIT